MLTSVRAHIPMTHRNDRYLVPVTENPNYEVTTIERGMVGGGFELDEPQYEATMTENDAAVASAMLSNGSGGGSNSLLASDDSLRKRLPSYLVPVAENPEYHTTAAVDNTEGGSSCEVGSTVVYAEVLGTSALQTDYDIVRENGAVYDTAGDGSGTARATVPRSSMDMPQYAQAGPTGAGAAGGGAPLQYEYADAAAIMRANSVHPASHVYVETEPDALLADSTTNYPAVDINTFC